MRTALTLFLQTQDLFGELLLSRVSFRIEYTHWATDEEPETTQTSWNMRFHMNSFLLQNLDQWLTYEEMEVPAKTIPSPYCDTTNGIGQILVALLT